MNDATEAQAGCQSPKSQINPLLFLTSCVLYNVLRAKNARELEKVRLNKTPEVEALFDGLPPLVAHQLQLLIFAFPVAIDRACSDRVEPWWNGWIIFPGSHFKEISLNSLAVHCHCIGSSVVYGQQIGSTWAWKFHLQKLNHILTTKKRQRTSLAR